MPLKRIRRLETQNPPRKHYFHLRNHRQKIFSLHLITSDHLKTRGILPSGALLRTRYKSGAIKALEGSSHYKGLEGSSHYKALKGGFHYKGLEGSSHYKGLEGS